MANRKEYEMLIALNARMNSEFRGTFYSPPKPLRWVSVGTPFDLTCSDGEAVLRKLSASLRDLRATPRGAPQALES